MRRILDRLRFWRQVLTQRWGVIPIISTGVFLLGLYSLVVDEILPHETSQRIPDIGEALASVAPWYVWMLAAAAVLMLGTLEGAYQLSRRNEPIIQGGSVNFGIKQDSRAIRIKVPINTEKAYQFSVSPRRGDLRYRLLSPTIAAVDRRANLDQREKFRWQLEGTPASRDFLIWWHKIERLRTLRGVGSGVLQTLEINGPKAWTNAELGTFGSNARGIDPDMPLLKGSYLSWHLETAKYLRSEISAIDADRFTQVDRYEIDGLRDPWPGIDSANEASTAYRKIHIMLQRLDNVIDRLRDYGARH